MKDTILEKDTFCVTVDDSHNFSCTVVTIGRTGENAVSQFEITIPDELSKFWAYLDFKKPSGKTLKTPRLDIVNNRIEYDIPQGLLDENGNIEAQLVLQSESGEVWKSTVKKFVVLKSIDAGDDIPEPESFITEAQRILDETQKVLDETVETTESFITEANEILSRVPETREVDPVFSNNSWEAIKWVAQNDDPSKYWKVGDYKEILLAEKIAKDGGVYISAGDDLNSIGEDLIAIKNNTIGDSVGEIKITNSSEIVDLASKNAFSPAGVLMYVYEDGSYSGWTINSNFSGIRGFSKAEEDRIMSALNYTYNGSSYPIVLTILITTVLKEYPLQIIGFNHDKVTDPYSYGKQRAGLTLQLGASRNIYGDTKPSVYEGVIDGLMEADGIHFKAPNKVLSDFTEGATNWADGGFRIALQSLFDGTEIAPYLTEVKKQTSHHYQESQRWSALMDTADKVFLPSEWECYGEVLYAPAREGDQYELYKEGYSKFMWSSELLSGAVTAGRLHFRSAVGSKVGTDLDSKYNCGVYITVKNLDPVSVSHAYSYASGGGFIAPCICL